MDFTAALIVNFSTSYYRHPMIALKFNLQNVLLRKNLEEVWPQKILLCSLPIVNFEVGYSLKNLANLKGLLKLNGY